MAAHPEPPAIPTHPEPPTMSETPTMPKPPTMPDPPTVSLRADPAAASALTELTHVAPSSAPPTLDAARLLLPLHGKSLTPAVLGRGTFGIVYGALLDAACPVAVKVLRAAPSSPYTLPLRAGEARHAAVAARQFRREVRRYAALRGVSGVVRFYGVAAPPPRPPSPAADPARRPVAAVEMFVTERMWGGSLREAVKTHPLDALSSVRVASVVSAALAEIHRRGFSHGDIKPANVLFSDKLSRHGGRVADAVQVKLVDFGLSRSFRGGDDAADEEDDDESVRSASSRGSAPAAPDDATDADIERAAASLLGPLDARGTPAYLSPEAWCGAKALRDREVAQKADVYALAMIMYELDAGHAPWSSLSEWGIFVAVCNHSERPSWPEDRAEVLPGFRALVERCWAQDHRVRPTCQEVADELARLREHAMRLSTATIDSTHMLSSTHSSPRLPSDILPIMNYISDLSASLGATAAHKSDSTVQGSRCSKEEMVANGDDADLTTLGHEHSSGAEGQVGPESIQAQIPSQIEKSDGGRLSPATGGQTVVMTNVSVEGSGETEIQRNASTELSSDEASVNGGYEADCLSQANVRGSDQTMSSSRPTEEGAEDHPDGGTCSVTARHAQCQEYKPVDRSLDYAFKAEVMNNDCEALCRAVVENERKPREATLAIEALSVSLEKDPENCKRFAKAGGLRTMSRILSRYGSKDSRLCKSACVSIYRMAACQSPTVETELRTTGACEIVLNSIRWHPTKLPVVQNAACAVNALCRASPALCSIVLALGGTACAQRVLARSSVSFQRDVPVASAGLEIIGRLAREHASALTEDESIPKVLECCDAFRDERIDRHCLSILHSVTRHPAGQDKLLSPVNMRVLAGLIHRTTEATEATDHIHKLTIACNIVAGLASSPKRDLARAAFLSSPIVEVVVQFIVGCDKPSTGSIGGTSLAIAVLESLRSMTCLGTDICGSLQMAKAFDATHIILNNHPGDRTVAIGAVSFLEEILKELRYSEFGADLDTAFEMLLQLQQRWHREPTLHQHIREALQIVREKSNQDENCRLSNRGSQGILEVGEPHRSSLRLFMRRKLVRNR